MFIFISVRQEKCWFDVEIVSTRGLQDPMEQASSETVSNIKPPAISISISWFYE